LRTAAFGLVALSAWSVLAYKLRHLRQTPGNWFLAAWCLAGLMVASSETLAMPPVASFLEQRTGVLAIWYLGPTVMIGPTVVLTLHLWTHPPAQAWRRTRPLFVVCAAVVLTMLVLDVLGRVDPRLVDIPGHAEQAETLYGATRHVRDAVLLYSVTLACTDVYLTRLFWRYAKLVDRRWLRRGLRCVGWGTATMVASFTGLAVVLIGLRFSADVAAVELLWPALASLGVFLAVVGGAIPLWGPWYDSLTAHRQLYPLWTALSCAHPEILLDQSRAVRAQRWLPWRIHYVLYRRVIEIRDGWLALRPYLPATAMEGDQVPEPAPATDLARATRAARDLDAALRAEQSGRAPQRQPVPSLVAGGQDLTEELAWLTKVAAAFTALRQAALLDRAPDPA
jgi:hypothetical protein